MPAESADGSFPGIPRHMPVQEQEKGMAQKKETQKLIANHKKAYHDYFIEESYEAGIALHGTEVKSMRMGKCSVKESFIRIENGEIFVYGMHVSPYEKGNIFNKDPLRVKKLLMHKYEINKLAGKVIPWCPCRCILKMEKSRWKSVLPVVKSCMTSGRILRKKTSAGRWRETLKSGICRIFIYLLTFYA